MYEARKVSKKQPVSSVKASSQLYPALILAQFTALAPQRGFRVERFGEISGFPLLALTKRTPGPRPRIYLSAGIHGDEPAPPLALLRLLEQGFFDTRAVWFLCPLLNPVGASLRIRENAEQIDLNRDYRHKKSAEIAAHIRWLERQPPFDLSFCLHEDWEAKGFYLYELNPTQRPSLAEAMIAAVEKNSLIDPSALIDEREAIGGIIRPDVASANRELWPEALYLRQHHSTLTYTIETPSAVALEERIAAHCVALTAALAQFAQKRSATQQIRDKR